MPVASTTKTWLVSFGAGNALNSEAIIAQGIDDITHLGSIEPDDIDVICNSARKPGGTILNGARPLEQVPNPGRPIPALFQKRLKLAVLAARHYEAVGRPIEPSTMSWDRVKHFRHLEEINNNLRDPESLPALS